MNGVWVTGARGFIGRAVAHQASVLGAKVSGLGHGAWSVSAAAANGLTTWVNGEISASNLRGLAAGGVPDTIYHLAGGSSVGAAIAQPREDFARTVESTAELLEWVRQESPATTVVVVSSAAVYGAGHDRPIGEAAATNPFSPYGAHKLMMETLCRSYGASFGIRSVIARVFSAYGPGLRKQLLWDTCTKLAAADTRIELGGDGRELRDYVHVNDLANIIVALHAHASAAAPVVNIGSARATSVRDLAMLLLDAWSTVTGKPPATPTFNGRSRAGDPRYLVSDNTLLRSLGLEVTVPLERGIREYVEWFTHRQTEAD